MTPAMLQMDRITSGYGRVTVLHDVSLAVDRTEIVTLIGANGAGKSTLLHTLAGLLRPRAGTVLLDGTDATGLPAEAMARAGVTLVPEGRQLFGPMTVRENLLLGAHVRRRRGPVVLDRVLALFPVLAERTRQRADSLSGGEQQMLALGRALMSEPRLILLDEPSLGLAPIVVDQLFETLDLLRREGTTIVLVEQHAAMALRIADRAYVLDRGRIVIEGSAREVAADPDVRARYLGQAATGVGGVRR